MLSWLEFIRLVQDFDPTRMQAAVAHMSAALLILDEIGADIAAARLSEALDVLKGETPLSGS